MKRRWWLAPLLVIAMAACTPTDGGDGADVPTSEPTEAPTTAPGVIDY